MAKKILIVDDEPDILDILKYNLEKEGYRVKKAKDGEEALIKAKEDKPDMIILDIMMPKKNGIEVCKELRKSKRFNDTYIIFLTAKNEELSEVAGFDVGADDYVVKPIKPRSLISRIKTLFLRRRVTQGTEEAEILNFGNLTIDLSQVKVYVKSKEKRLTKREFDILKLLSSRPEKAFSRETIYHHIWGEETIVGDRTLDVHIRKIREKIGEKYIDTIKGIGYTFKH